MGGDGPHATRTSPGATIDGPGEAERRPLRVAGLVAPPLVLMGLIWYLSSRSHLGTDLGWIDLVLRKGAHMTEYALLTLLWARAVRGLVGTPAGAGRAWAPAAAVALAWAALDELHQRHVPGRHGTPRDVAIDAVGIAVGVLAWRLLRRRRAP